METPEDGVGDPVLRCDSCQTLVKRETLHKVGACPKCGNRRVRNVTVFDEVEKAQLEAWGFHEFVADFAGVADA
jgi:DNA-directed RNA polymerase subunit RPC12/RpoP